VNGWVVLGCSVFLFIAAVFSVIRIVIGPKTLDRMIGVDLLVTTIVGAIGLEAVYHRNATTLPVLVVLTLVGFVGSVAVARFSTYEMKTKPPQPPTLRFSTAARDLLQARKDAKSDLDEGGEQ